jgi:hypothetical protein
VYPTLAVVKEHAFAAWVSKAPEQRSVIRLQPVRTSN